MIVNISRAKTWFTCRRKYFDTYYRSLQGDRRSMNLVDGSAVHKGIAAGMATKDWDAAQAEAMKQFDVDIQAATLLPEEAYLVEQHKRVVTRILEVYRDGYATESYQVIQPECEFEIELPGSEHNCINMHWLDRNGNHHWTKPIAQDIIEGVYSPHMNVIGTYDKDCACYQPHRFTGKTDAIVIWNGNIWLLEHKTTAISGQQFWSQWQLDIQPTGYIYGIWKALKVRPRGFVLNALVKPSEGQVASWNKSRKYGENKAIADYIKYEREPFLRTEEDLQRVEHQLIGVCNDIESSIIKGYEQGFYMSPVPGACVAYNRLCDFHAACSAHDSDSSLESLSRRDPDYVDEALVRISLRR